MKALVNMVMTSIRLDLRKAWSAPHAWLDRTVANCFCANRRDIRAFLETDGRTCKPGHSCLCSPPAHAAKDQRIQLQSQSVSVSIFHWRSPKHSTRMVAECLGDSTIR